MTIVQNVKRDDIYKDIAQLITESPDKESEVSLVDLAKKYGIASPTMDYHIKKLEEEGKIIQTSNRGRYNRKKYTLPEKDLNQLHKGLGSEQSFIDYVEGDINLPLPPKKELALMPLDDHIQEFLSKINGTISTEEILTKDDREILSITTETLQQTIVFMRDVVDQLTTVKSKDLIMRLVDERNETQKKIEDLKKQVSELKGEVEAKQQGTPLDPQRIRFMQQMLMSTIDNYINQNNVSMTMTRKDFQEQVFKELKDLVDYALGITA